MQCVQYWLGKGVRQLTSTTLPYASLFKSEPDLDLRSMNELAEVAERIISNLNAVFVKDNELDEFDIVPQEVQANRSPVIHQQHKLGLESWCIGFVYSHSFRNFIILRPQKSVQPKSQSTSVFHSKTFRPSITAEYCDLTEAEKWRKCLELTRLIVLINPDVTTAWNFRREAVTLRHSSLRDEFQLVSLVASRKPKCSEAFCYRKFLLQETLKAVSMDLDHLMALFQREIKAAHEASSKYLSNYHAWDYRRFVVETWLSHGSVPLDMKSRILNSEVELSSTWFNTHISDYCGYHYRQKLLAYVINFQQDPVISRHLLQKELNENRGMLLFYPGHESLWYHRKFLVKHYSDLFTLPDRQEETFLLMLSNEHNLVDGISPNGNHESLKNPVENDCIRLNRTYAQRYLTWLRNTF